MNRMVTETQQGTIRMQETRGEPLFAVLRGSLGVLRQVLRSPETLFTTGLMLVLGISRMISGTFWSILVTEKLQIPPQHLALYPFARSMVMLLFYFLVMPRLRRADARRPMLWGFLGLIASQVILVSVPAGNYWLLLLATLLEGGSFPVVSTLLEKLVVVTVDPKERARIMALLSAVVIVFTSPFGWIAGRVSEVNRSLPFVLNIALFAVGCVLAYAAGRPATEEPAQEGVQA
jgi:hypothetical protein